MPKHTLVEVWCEWDIGQGGLVFANAHVAEHWLRNNLVLHQMAEDDGKPFDEYYQELADESLIGIEDLRLIE